MNPFRPLVFFSAAFVLLLALRASADPQLSSWFTADSGQYARIFQTTANETAGSSSTTWSRGSGVQTNPTYAGVSEIVYSANWVYIRTTGLASHMMGPWYLDVGKTQNFPNFPSNTATIYRIPRTPTVLGTKTLTGGGAIGYFVNGVAFFDNRDTFSYSTSNAKDADPTAGIGLGDGIWVRDAYPNESATFDAALAHQAGNQYHYHVQPVALRFLLGDHVTYVAATNRYAESAAAVTAHSPILAWAQDGYPVYGPYGYSTAMDATSPVRRIVSGFVLRDGSNGTTNLNTAKRRTLAAWSAAWQGRSATLATTAYGPDVSATYALGHYLEDYDFLGDLGFTQGVVNAGGVYFNLDRYNGRTCVTPEFPGGTYAYFSTLKADGTPAFPYNIGRQFYGSPTGGSTTIAETVTTYFQGGPNKASSWSAVPAAVAGGNVTLTWSAVEGGTYQVSATSDVTTAFTALTPAVTAAGDSATFPEAAAATNHTARFYKVTRTALATFDGSGFNYTQTGGGGGGTAVAPGGSAARGTTVAVTITLGTTPAAAAVEWRGGGTAAVQCDAGGDDRRHYDHASEPRHGPRDLRHPGERGDGHAEHRGHVSAAAGAAQRTELHGDFHDHLTDGTTPPPRCRARRAVAHCAGGIRSGAGNRGATHLQRRRAAARFAAL